MRNPKSIAMLAVIGLMAFGLGATVSQDAIADQKSMVGSWVVEVSPNGPPDFTNLVTFTVDGSIINSDPDIGTGHGAWIQTGVRTFATTFSHLVPPDMISVRSSALTVDQGGDEATGPFETFLVIPDGTEIPLFDGTAELTRITVGE